jgi:hypothetical protein
MARQILPRNNFYDGQNVDETDLDVDQAAWHGSLANNTDFLAGSGVEQEFAIQRLLFDSDDVPASIQTLIDTQNFDGEPIYPIDSFNNTVYLQPSDAIEGNQLEVTLDGAALDGAPIARVFLFGLAFGGRYVQEVLTFEENGAQVTRTYFTSIVAIMAQDFLGNQNTIIDGVASRNVGGRLTIKEALAMTVALDTVMVAQDVEPNMNYVNFKPATLSKTLDIILDEISDSESLNTDDLDINITASDSRTLPRNDSTGLIVGEKFQATTNNIQKITVLLSVQENTLALPGHEFDWSGDIVVGVRALQTTTDCPTDTIPNTLIEFDPQPSALSEVSFDQDELAELGIALDDTPRPVDFVFTQSLLANPNIAPDITPGAYYALTIRRSGNVSTGTIVLQEAANTTRDTEQFDNMRMTIFSQNKWTDVPESDLWFIVHTDAVRIVDGTAFDGGIQITSPKVKKNDATGIEEPFIEGFHSLIDVSQNSENYIIVQRAQNFTDPEVHPSTGNPIFSRIEDIPQVAVVSAATLTTLIDAGNETIILGSVRDTNPVSNPQITGRTDFPGLATASTFTIIQPNSDITLNNLVGSILIPNTNESELQYRIIKVVVFDDAYGDVNGDGLIDLNDVARAQILDGYSKDLESGTIPSSEQRNAILTGTVTMDEIIRADVTADGIVSIFDPQSIQQNIALGTAFNAGSTYKRAVLTVENLTSPLTTSPDITGADSVYNTVPFTPVNFRINFVPLWKPSNVILTDLRRFIPKTFTVLSSTDITNDPPSGGVNTAFIPGDILLQGELLNLDGSAYAIDFEVNTIVIDLPEGSTQGEIDIFNNFIKNQMKFSDGTVVPLSALEGNQVKVTASIKSFTKDRDGYDFESIDGYAAIHETVSLLYTQTSGLLRIRANHIRYISTRPELRTKILLTVYLKKAGFQNTERAVTPTELTDLLTPV